MKEKMYSVAIRKRLNNCDHFWQHDDYEFLECKINTFNGRYWFADPFLYEREGVLYLFYEVFDLIERRGKEGYSYLKNDGNWSDPRIIIDEPFHLSFPYIFDYNGDVFIMPEMSGDYSLKAYKAISFPDKWEVSDVILPDVYACDSVLIEFSDKRYLLTNEMFHNVPNGQYSSCWVKNYLYEMDGLKAVEDGVKIAEGDFGIRNAGKIFDEKGVLYRIGQDCRNRLYGCGMVLFEIESIVPYKEKVVANWTCSDLAKHIRGCSNMEIVGSHTYNFNENYEVIDYSTFKDVSPYVVKERRMKRFLSILKRIKNKIM